jgi:UDP-3-O-[3-hydroxymyristoyl] glucosamine N-acyltransferase
MVTAYTPVTQSVDKPGVYSGTIVFHEHGKWRRNALRFNALDDLFKRVKKLEAGLRHK